MENQKEPNLREGMGMKDKVDAETKRSDEKYDFGEIEQKVDELDKKINTPIGEDDKDQEGPLSVGRKIDKLLDVKDRGEIRRRSILPILTPNEKIELMGMLFPIGLGDRVRNKLTEDGIVEMVGVDHRGALYLVMYKDQTSRWESEAQIEKTQTYGPGPLPPGPIPGPFDKKTDVPDPKAVKRGDRVSELE